MFLFSVFLVYGVNKNTTIVIRQDWITRVMYLQHNPFKEMRECWERQPLIYMALSTNMAGLVPFWFSVNSLPARLSWISSSLFSTVGCIKVLMRRYFVTDETLLCADSTRNSYVDEKETCFSSGHAPGHENNALAIIWAEMVFGKMWFLGQKQGHGDKDRTFLGHV